MYRFKIIFLLCFIGIGITQTVVKTDIAISPPSIGTIEPVINLTPQINPSTIVITNEDFIREDPGYIKELKSLSLTDECFKRHIQLFLYMGNVEQRLFLEAYKTQQTENPSEKRCFSPEVFKKSFLKSVIASNTEFTSRITQRSISVRKSLSCITETFSSLGSSLNEDYESDVKNVIDAQGQSNQCLASFLTILTNTLNARRKYLLLNDEVQKEAAIYTDGYISSFVWTEEEVNTLTPSFIKFATCFSSFPNSFTNVVNEVQNKLAFNPYCSAKMNLENVKTEVTANTTDEVIKPVVLPLPTDSTNKYSDPILVVPDVIPSNTVEASVVQKPTSLGIVSIDSQMQIYIEKVILNLNQQIDTVYSLAAKALKSALESTNKKVKCDFVGSLASSLKNGGLLLKHFFLVNNEQTCSSNYVYFASNSELGGNGVLKCTLGECEKIELIWTTHVLASFSIAIGCIDGKRFAFASSSDSINGDYFDFIAPGMKLCGKSAEKSNKCANYYVNLANQSYRMLQTTKPIEPIIAAPVKVDTEIVTVDAIKIDTNIIVESPKIPDISVNNTDNSNSVIEGDADGCAPSMKTECSKSFNKFCVYTGLFKSLASYIPSITGSSLPNECQGIDDIKSDYTKCFTWIVRNLIIDSLIPNYKAIYEIQTTIVKSQTEVDLRFLQNNEEQVKIVQTDPYLKDSKARLEPEAYALKESDTKIDGNTSTAQADTIDKVSEITLSVAIALAAEYTPVTYNNTIIEITTSPTTVFSPFTTSTDFYKFTYAFIIILALII